MLMTKSLLVVFLLLVAGTWAQDFGVNREITLEANVVDMMYTMQQKYLLIAYKQNKVAVHNGVTAKLISQVDLNKAENVTSIAMSNDNAILAVGFIDGVTKTYKNAQGTFTEDKTLTDGQTSVVQGLCFSSDNKKLVIGLLSNKILLADVNSGQIQDTTDFDQEDIFTVACHPSEAQFIAGGGQNNAGKLTQFSFDDTGNITKQGDFELSQLTTTLSAIYSKDATVVFRSTKDGKVFTYNAVNRQQTQMLETSTTGPLHKLTVSDQQEFLTTVSDSQVLIYQQSQIRKLTVDPKQAFETDLITFAAAPTGALVTYKKSGANTGQVLGYCVQGQYFNQAQGLCVACSTDCSLCQGDSQTCFECDAAFYLDGTSCLACSQGCIQCKSDIECTMCNEAANFVPQPQNGSCICVPKHFKNGAKCDSCIDGCQVCQDATTCDQCDTDHKKEGDVCACADGKYDDQGQCKDCILGCAKCENGQKCITCDETQHFIKDQDDTCQCNAQGHYIFDNATSTCICQDRFYPTTQACQPCSIGCQLCTSAETCTKCLNNLTLSEGVCTCDAAHYISQATITCQACSQALDYCEQCNTNTTCTKCQQNIHRVPKQGQCKCQNGYYENETVCQSCDITGCLQCTDTQHCTLCDDSKGWTVDPNTNLCMCKPHYVNISNVCVQCSIGCIQCENKQQCDKCDQANHFIKKNSTAVECQCERSYWLNNQTCDSCMVGCTDCQVGDVCQQCDTPGHFQKDGDICKCSTQYFLSNTVCVLCSQRINNCLQCSSGNTCTKCSKSIFHVEKGQCLCDKGKYISKDTCESCPDQCSACQNKQKCTDCQEGFDLDGGYCKKSGLDTLIIVLIVLGVVVVAGAVFVLIKCIKKKRAPLLDEYEDLES